MIHYKILDKLMIGNTLVGLTLEDKESGLKHDMALEEIKDALIVKSISIEGLSIDSNLELLWSPHSSNIRSIEKTTNFFMSDNELIQSISSVTNYNKRKQYNKIINWIKSDKSNNGVILALYGLRRTGKTVLLLQTAKWLIDNGYKVAYGEIHFGTENNGLSNEIDNKVKSGYNAIIIDEITLSSELMANNLLPDKYAKLGVKVIVAGTQSLMIKESSESHWYDRVEIINTTFISAKEFTRLYRTASLQDYIKFGGVLSNSRVISNSFNSLEYIKTSISDNIKHTLELNPDSSRINGIRKAIENDSFDSIMALIAETTNIEGLLSKLRKEYKSQILGSAIQLYNKKISSYIGIETPIMTGIPKSCIKIWNNNIQRILNIKSIVIDSVSTHLISQIISTLNQLDYITYYRTQSISGSSDEILLNQPGIRYQQAVQIIHIINDIIQSGEVDSTIDKQVLFNQIIEDIEGRLLEEALAVNFIQLYSDAYDIYKYLGVQGEIDIAVRDRKSNKVCLMEVKRSTKIIPEYQSRWLVDTDLNNEIQSGGVKIQSRYVMYLGNDADINYNGYKIMYRNIESLLKTSNRF